MPKKSAGIIVYRRRERGLEVLLVHPGGPFFAKKDAGVWSIPKGEFTNEAAIEAARREFREEVGCLAPESEYIELTPVVLPSLKTVFAWGVEGDLDTTHCTSNLFELEWPPHSGTFQKFPEVDEVRWLTVDEAREKLSNGQFALIEELATRLTF